jgi:hypothetical protein
MENFADNDEIAALKLRGEELVSCVACQLHLC